MNDLAAASKIIGTHEVHFTPPDVVHCVIRGVLRGTDAPPFIDFVLTYANRAGGKVYCIYDMSKFERLTNDVRKVAVNVDQPYPYSALAIIVSSFTVRTLVDMILRAGKIVASKYFLFPYKFVASADEAHAWFDELRKKQRQS